MVNLLRAPSSQEFILSGKLDVAILGDLEAYLSQNYPEQYAPWQEWITGSPSA